MEKSGRRGHVARSGKRRFALLMSLCLIGTMIPAMSGGANKVQAATGSGTEPSVSAYATKEQLMTAFTPDSNGNATTIGKLVFGKKSDGTTSQEWYILGKDTGVSGDNTIIFAASPIATNQVFENDWWSNKTYDSSFGVYTSNPTDVYPNHYGASDLRVALKNMATSETYFTSAEQGLMNATTVTTKDTENSATYTTTDKLYVLAADGFGSSYKTIKAGTSDSTVLAMDSYRSSGDWFWLRSPDDGFANNVLLADPGYCVYNREVKNMSAVQPASNLNLSSVLFASAATAASSDTVSGTITDGTAMTLRLNGTSKDIGAAIYNAEEGTIEVRKGSTSQTVALVVQGNDGTNDWYYSKKIDTSETVNASAIKLALSLSSDINLSDCKIWLEIRDTDGLIYAVGADKEIEPINTTYVTKEQLMSSFKPYSDGTAVNIGKLVFGKKSDGTTSQEWYILGKDTGVSGDNTIIFAASPIATNQVFEDDYSNYKDFQASFGVYENAPIDVFPNHYGASDLRVALQGMATNTNYFTSAEQGLMNATTVTTNDTKNSATYTTTDKLYALQGDSFGDTKLWAGTSDSTVLAMNSYWSNGSWFWLRSPYASYGSYALHANPGLYVDCIYVSGGGAVQPASNLNLSSVLFASAATAASSDTVVADTITSGTAMTLRLNGTGKDIGTVTYNTTTGDIKAAKGSTEGDVALVVQGNDGTNDWYYSKKIDTSETVNASAIKSALSLSSDINLSDCKIWLETTDSTENLIYAVGATEILSITSVEITGIDTPVSNTTLDTGASCATTGVSNTTPQITWTPSDSTAGYNTSYTASITLTADTGYEFIDSTTATVNTYTATGVTKNDDGTLTVTYAFPATAKRVIGSVTAPKVPTNNIFTTYYGYAGYDISPVSGSNSELGTQATVTFTDSVNPNTEAMDVTWSIANAGGAAYDQTPGAKNTFRWTIPAAALTNYNATDCQGYDATTGTITGTVAITNKAAIPVTITGTDSGVAYTGETIDVSQYFTIDSHAGTATYSLVTGVDGGTGVGTLSGTTLTVTKTGTFKIKVETLANGIYGAGEKTITLTVSNGTPDNSTPDNTTPAKEMGLTGGDWKLDDGKWWYDAADNSYPSNGWAMIEGEWYAFDETGYMETGWYQSGNDWYYLGSSGAMETGWVQDGDTWYYMNASGAMETGWVQDGDTWYYMNASGAMETGWIWDGANWYYMNAGGAMATGWVWDGANWYYMNASGAMETGWIWDGANWYYMYSNGAMAHDVVIGGYRLSASGAWVQ